MRRISDALREIIADNQVLQFGLHNRILNLSQLARFLQPQVEARTRKEVQTSAILMSLSRLCRAMPASAAVEASFEVENITVHSGLCVVTVPKGREMHRRINTLYNRLQRRAAYITISEGTSEITFISNQEHLEAIREALGNEIADVRTEIGSISVKFRPLYLERPGFLAALLQQLALQNINIVEMASTATECILYLEESDIRLAFDTLYNSFRKDRIRGIQS